jgi:hypothetical protein
VALAVVLVAAAGAVAVIDAAPTGSLAQRSVADGQGVTDTDGDGLPDRWERATGTDPRHKTLPVVVRYTADTTALTTTERRRLRAIFARMPVANPDGTTGIALRFRNESRTDRSVAITRRALDRYERRYATGETVARPCREHLLVVATPDVQIGRAGAPGRVALVQGSERAHTQRRTVTVVHELLHTIVGRLPTDDPRVASAWHTTDGWLRPHDEAPRLSAVTTAALDKGFASPPYCRAR